MPLFHKKYTNLSYDVDWDIFIFDNLPVKFRQVKIFKYLSVVFNGVKESYNKFIQDREDVLILQNVNGQTIVLEKYLQDLYGDSGIYIENSGSLAQTKYLYKPSETPQELEETNLYDSVEFATQPIDRQTYLSSKSEIETGVDFIVYVPFLTLQNLRVSQIEAVVDKYRFVGTIYKVEGY